MKRDIWNINFDWVQSGITWIRQDRNEQYDDNRFISINDIYFKYQKYLSGVSYIYVNKLEDIYKRDLLTGDGYSLYNMYNEYDIVDRVMKNIKMVDVASKSNVDITTQWRKINNIQLKQGQYVLLYNQDSEYENDVYKVNDQYFLENANFLSTRTNSERFSVSIKSGTYKDKQFFLLNNGTEFPITGEPKHFVEGNSFILKNIIKYNIYNVSNNSAVTSKIIFTDYEIAKKQLPVNAELYDDISYIISDIQAVSSSYFHLQYHHDDYYIRTGTTSDREVSGYTSQISNSFSGGTTISGVSPFNSNNEDYIRIIITSGSTTGTTLVDFYTHIKDKTVDTILIEDKIPNRILRYVGDNMYLKIYNMNIATSWLNAIEQLIYTPYSKYYDVSYLLKSHSYRINISPKDYKYNSYFDYNDLKFYVIDDSMYNNFNSLNNYITYNLYNRLNVINSSIFTSSFSFHNNFSTTSFSYEYLKVYTDIVGRDQNIIKITLNSSSDISYFREYTYVYLNYDILNKCLIWKIEGGDIYVERPTNISYGDSITNISNIDGLYKISEILQEVYINVDHSWYISKKDNIRRKICSSYAQLLSENEDFRYNVTGILYENEYNEFILKLYDLETDYQLEFTTIELMKLGVDKKVRIPVPIDSKNLVERTTYTIDWNVLDDGFIYTGSTMTDYLSTASNTEEVFDFGYDVVLGGPNDPPLMFNIIDGNDS